MKHRSPQNQKSKPNRRKCAHCKKWFTPYRQNQRYCVSTCRYQAFAQHHARIRVREITAEALSLHYVKSSHEAQPLGYFPHLADARNFAATLRRRQRNTSIKHRFSIGRVLLRATTK